MRLGALVAALLALIALAELGLRTAEWISLDARKLAQAHDGDRTVLCLGDSWTYGQESGDPARWSYPARLQQLFDRRLGRSAVRVVNEGLPGATSGRLRAALPGLLERHRPTVVVMMVGHNNWFEMGIAGSSGQVESGPATHWGRNRLLAPAQGPLGQFKVVRLLRLLLAPSTGTVAADVRRQANGLRSRLLELFHSPEARAADAGAPVLPVEGCIDPLAARRQAETLIKAGTSGAWQTDSLALAAAEPGCTAYVVARAELCYLAGDYTCAVEQATEAMARVGVDEPRSAIVELLSRRQLEGRWPEYTELVLGERFAYLGGRYVRFTYASVLAEVERSFHLCMVQSGIRAILGRCPGCRWARRALALVEHSRSRSGGRIVWQYRNDLLRADLAAMAAMIRRAGAALLLLNYPTAGDDPCRGITIDTVTSFAASTGVPLLDLGQVLGPDDPGAPSGLYGKSGHPNAAGYARLADAVGDRLRALGWIHSSDAQGALRASGQAPPSAER